VYRRYLSARVSSTRRVREPNAFFERNLTAYDRGAVCTNVPPPPPGYRRGALFAFPKHVGRGSRWLIFDITPLRPFVSSVSIRFGLGGTRAILSVFAGRPRVYIYIIHAKTTVVCRTSIIVYRIGFSVSKATPPHLAGNVCSENIARTLLASSSIVVDRLSRAYVSTVFHFFVNHRRFPPPDVLSDHFPRQR